MMRRWTPILLLASSLLGANPAMAQSADSAPQAIRARAEMMSRAGQALEAGDLDRAEELLRTVAESGESARALLWLARLDIRRGRYGESIAWLEAALELAPHAEEILRSYARASMARQSLAPAIWALESLIRMHPENADYAYLLGVARLQLGDSLAAVAELERALPLQDRPAKALLALGLAYNKLKRFGEARDALEESLATEPGEPEAISALAESLQGLGENDGAERLARRCLELSTDHARAHLVLGLIRMERGDFAAAAEAFEASVAADPDEPKGRYQLSLAYARLGERGKAKQQLELYDQAQEAIEKRLLEQFEPNPSGGENQQ